MSAPVINAAPLIASLGRCVGPLTCKRAGVSEQNEFGGLEAPALYDVTLDPVAAHTVSGRELDQVPEADRNSEIVRFYTTVRLFVADEGKMADRIEYPAGSGRTYRIVRVEDYAAQGGVYSAMGALEEASS